MPKPAVILRSIALVLLLAAALCAGLWVGYRSSSGKSASSRYQTMHGWQTISGRWNERDAVFSNSNYGRGDMLVAQHSQGTNYSVSADIRFDLLFPETHYGDAGLVIRTTDPEQGVDSYQGYYAGIRPDQQTVILGRASYDWHELASKRLGTPVSVGSWYRVTLSAQACSLVVTVTPESGTGATRLEYEDSQCLTQGVAGLRSFYAQASWRNVRITPD
jgi:hypothetical protein